MASHHERNRPTLPPEPGPNPLFFGVIAAVVVGIAVGVGAGDATLLKSNLIFRVVSGGVVSGVLYLGVVAIWLAWHRRTFRRISLPGGGGAEAPDPAEISARDREITEFMDTTTKAIEELRRRSEGKA